MSPCSTGGTVTNSTGAFISGGWHQRRRRLHHRRDGHGHEPRQHRERRPALRHPAVRSGGSISNAAGATIIGRGGGRVRQRWRRNRHQFWPHRRHRRRRRPTWRPAAASTTRSGGSISGNSFGVFITGGSGAVVNTGNISSSVYGAVELAEAAASRTTRPGPSTAAPPASSIGSGGAGTVTNSGLISATGAASAGVDLGARWKRQQPAGRLHPGHARPGVFAIGLLGDDQQQRQHRGRPCDRTAGRRHRHQRLERGDRGRNVRASSSAAGSST